jgi:hypothetical protein
MIRTFYAKKIPDKRKIPASPGLKLVSENPPATICMNKGEPPPNPDIGAYERQ